MNPVVPMVITAATAIVVAVIQAVGNVMAAARKAQTASVPEAEVRPESSERGLPRVLQWVVSSRALPLLGMALNAYFLVKECQRSDPLTRASVLSIAMSVASIAFIAGSLLLDFGMELIRRSMRNNQTRTRADIRELAEQSLGAVQSIHETLGVTTRLVLDLERRVTELDRDPEPSTVRNRLRAAIRRLVE